MNGKEWRRLVRLIRRIAKEAACEALDEHLRDYEHKEKPVSIYEALALLEGETHDDQ
ncbi:MAG: hypothetical protein N3F10_06655 [Candidatus Bathyarchaeota archaeon]|nr:hypothetical protein [Candidatus Bathyarchaeota archaeon]